MDKILQYLEAHSCPESEALQWVRKQTNLHTNQARMLSGVLQGTFLTILVRATHVHKALELGTFTGYSSICIANGLEDGGHLDTLEINDELNRIIKEGWERAGVSDRITYWCDDALNTLKTLDRHEDAGWIPYDFVYIDANKRHYRAYYEAVLPMVRKGGLILADNTLWDGKVVEDPLPVDAQTREIAAFNDMLASDNRVQKVMLPVRDGLTIIEKL